MSNSKENFFKNCDKITNVCKIIRPKSPQCENKKKEDPLKNVCFGMPLILIKFAIIHFIMSKGTNDLKIFSALNKILFQHPFIIQLRNFFIANKEKFPFGQLFSSLQLFKKNAEAFEKYVNNDQYSLCGLIMNDSPMEWNSYEFLFYLKFQIFRFNVLGKTDDTHDDIIVELKEKKWSGNEFFHKNKKEFKKLFQNKESFKIINEIRSISCSFFDIPESLNMKIITEKNSIQKNVDKKNIENVASSNKDAKIDLDSVTSLLKVEDIRKQLRKRKLDEAGSKTEISKRLSEAIIENAINNNRDDSSNNIHDKNNKISKKRKYNEFDEVYDYYDYYDGYNKVDYCSEDEDVAHEIHQKKKRIFVIDNYYDNNNNDYDE